MAEINIPIQYGSVLTFPSFKIIKPSNSIGIPEDISYNFRDEISFILPIELKEIVNCLKSAEYILTFKDNWDNEGSEGYSVDTWIGASLFLLEYAHQIYAKSGNCIDIPKIYPSSNGSIDIDWETETYGLIVNIAKGGELGTYYGDNKAKQMTEGIFNPKNFNINLLPKAIHL